jgi:hypothetical protein
MRVTIDIDAGMLTIDDEGRQRKMNLYSDEACETISRQWVRVG